MDFKWFGLDFEENEVGNKLKSVPKMNKIEQPSTVELIIKGYLWVNIPVTFVILIIWFSLWSVFNINYMICVFLGTLAGWYFWAFLIKKWIRWAFAKNTSTEKILKIGRLSFLFWNKSTMDRALNDEN